MELRRGRSTGVFALNVGLGDPEAAVSRCAEQQGNTCTMNKPLQVRAPLCLSEGLELGNRAWPRGAAAVGTLFPTRGQSIPRDQAGILFHRQNPPVELAALRYQSHRARGVSEEKWKRLEGVWMRRMALPAGGPLEKATSRMPPARGTSRNGSIPAARGFPRTSRTCAMLCT